MGLKLMLKSKSFQSAWLICIAEHAGIAQLVERNLAKVEVVGSNPISRSIFAREA